LHGFLFRIKFRLELCTECSYMGTRKFWKHNFGQFLVLAPYGNMMGGSSCNKGRDRHSYSTTILLSWRSLPWSIHRI